MKIKHIILFILCFVILFSQNQIINAEDIAWKGYIQEFLINNFPSLFDEAVIAKNEKEFMKYADGWGTLIISDFNFSHDIIPYSYHADSDIVTTIIIPQRPIFYDLDYDGIPEIIIAFISIDSGMNWGDVYKLYGTDYEKIGVLRESLYINPENKIVSINENETRSIEIINNQIIYSEYIDSLGNDNYNGVKYSEIGVHSDYFMFTSEEEALNTEVFLADLRYMLEIDCSDVLNLIKLSESPKTGDNFLLLFIALNIALFAIIKLKKKFA